MKRFFKKNISIILLLCLIVYLGLSLYYTKQNYEYYRIQQKSIPDIDLSNLQYEVSSELLSANDDYIVSASGFVAFYDFEQQPKDLRQYYIIDTDVFNTDLITGERVYKRKFSVEEIIKMTYLPPRSLGVDEIFINNESDDELILEDTSGNLFIIDKRTERIVIHDVTGDRTKLITDNNEFADFMKFFPRIK